VIFGEELLLGQTLDGSKQNRLERALETMYPNIIQQTPSHPNGIGVQVAETEGGKIHVHPSHLSMTSPGRQVDIQVLHKRLLAHDVVE
jgi:hypothetical protein